MGFIYLLFVGGSDNLRVEKERRWLVGGGHGRYHRALPWQLRRADGLVDEVWTRRRFSRPSLDPRNNSQINS